MKNLRWKLAQDAETYLISQAIPLSLKLQIIPAGISLQQIVDLPHSTEEIPGTETEDGRKKLAAMYLLSMVKNLRSLQMMVQLQAQVDAQQLVVLSTMAAQQGCLAGLLVAIAIDSNRHASRGAGGRRKIGDDLKQRVRDEAEGLKGTPSKDAAARLIAPKVKRSPSRVLRLLGELYPRDSWPPSSVT